MIYSMTGFGKSTAEYKFKTFHIEIRTVNSRHLDIRFKLPNTFKNHELELRSMMAKQIIRGKVDFILSVDSEEGDDDYTLNIPLLKTYYKKLKEVRDEFGGNDPVMEAVVRLPNVVKPNEEDADADEWQVVRDCAVKALTALNDYRRQEGDALYEDLRLRSINITTLLEKIEPFESDRMDTVRDRIKKNLADYVDQEIDQNRFEQEVIYYLEKYDITEEKVRLKQHCSYFMDVLDEDDDSKGRKLNFISQEMGREINTLGAKANHSEIQKLVVEMKDELEKIKEQTANIV